MPDASPLALARIRCAMKRALILAGLSVAMLTCAPPGGEAPDGRIRVEFWHAMGGEEHSTLMTQWVEEFEVLHPDIHIVPIYQGHYGHLSQKLIASVIARRNPPLAQMYEGWTSRFLTRGLIDPVENYIHGPDGMTPEEVQDIWEPFRRNNSWPVADVGGYEGAGGEDGQVLVTLPFNKSGYVLYINADMMRKAGYDRPPETWREMHEMARAMTVEGRGKPAVYGMTLRARIEAFTALLFRADARVLGNEEREVVVDSPTSRALLELLRTMIVDERIAYTDSVYPAIPFGSQQVAMYIHTTAAFWANDQAAAGKFQWIAAPLPHPEGRKGGVLFQGTNIGIFSRPHPPEVRRAAWKFLKFITNTENTARWSRATGYVVVRKSATELPEMRRFYAERPNYRVPISVIPEATFDPRPHYWDQMRPQIGTYALEAMNGDRPVDEALRLMTEKLRGIVEYEAR